MTAVDVLWPIGGPRVDLDGDDLRRWLADCYAPAGERWCRLNLAATLDGRIAPQDGGSDALAGGIDRALVGVLRGTADAVLVGAGTLRAERLPMPRRAVLAVATRSGSVDRGHLPEGADPDRVLVLCPAAVAPRVAERLAGSATVVPLPDDPVERPALLVDALRQRSLDRVLCEGGGALAAALLAAGVVDEVDLTTVPALLAPGAALTSGRLPLTDLTLEALLRDGTGRLYGRWIPASR